MEWVIYDSIGYGLLALTVAVVVWFEKYRYKKKKVIGMHIVNAWGDSFLVKPKGDPVLLAKEEAERLKRMQ